MGKIAGHPHGRRVSVESFVFDYIELFGKNRGNSFESVRTFVECGTALTNGPPRKTWPNSIRRGLATGDCRVGIASGDGHSIDCEEIADLARS